MADDQITTKIQVQIAKLEKAVEHIFEHYKELSEGIRTQNKELASEIKEITSQINDYYYLYENFKQHSEMIDEHLEERINSLKNSAEKLEKTVHDLELSYSRSIFKQLVLEISDSKILVILKWVIILGLMVLGVDRVRVLFDWFNF